MTEPKGEGAIEEALEHFRGLAEWYDREYRPDPPTATDNLDAIVEALASLRTAKEELEERAKIAEHSLAFVEEKAAQFWRESRDVLAAKETAERERDEARAMPEQQRLGFEHHIAQLKAFLSHSEAERGRLEEALKQIERFLVQADAAEPNWGVWTEQILDIARQALTNQPSNQEGRQRIMTQSAGKDDR